MTAKELISRLAPVELERIALIFNYLGDHVADLRLANGSRLHDGTDFAAFLHELASAVKCPEPVPDALARSVFLARPAGSVEGYTCTKVFHKGSRYEDRIQGNSLQNYAIAVSAALSREFGEHFPEDKPHIAALIEQTERVLRQFD